MTRLKAAITLLFALAAPAGAETCKRVTFDKLPFTVCTVDPAQETLRLFLRDGRGTPYGSFRRLELALQDQGLTLGAAMNGGMYHPDRRPVGLYIENGLQQMRLITSAGPGNFGLLPNGVLCLNEGRADIIETLAYRNRPPTCRDATQSGPMLVIDGALHPRFLKNSSSVYIRNGVGIDNDGRVHMAISDVPVTFHQFGRLFRDFLKTANALYLDGNISKLHAPTLGRSDGGLPMGPILGVAVPRPVDERPATQ